jgi:hypothetical protein
VAIVFAAALALQMWDVWPQHSGYVYLRNVAADPAARLHDPRWHTLAQGKKHLTLLPPNACGIAAGSYLPLTLLAASEHLTMNMAYLARWDERGSQNYCARLDTQLHSGHFDADELFVLGPDWRALFHARNPQASCFRLDGYETCVLSPANPAPLKTW